MGKSLLRRSKPLIILLLSTFFVTFLFSSERIKICRLELVFNKNLNGYGTDFKLEGKKILVPGYLYRDILFCGVGWFQNFITNKKGFFKIKNQILSPIGVDRRRGIYVFKRVNNLYYLNSLKGHPPFTPIFYGNRVILLHGMLLNKNLFCLITRDEIPPFLYPVLDESGDISFFIQKKFKSFKNHMGKTFEVIKKDKILESVKKIYETKRNIPMPYFGMFISNSPDGVLVKNILPEFSAYRFGVRRGDIIFFVDNFSIHTVEDFLDILKNLNPDRFHTFTIQRGDKIIKLKVKPDKK